MSNTANDLIRLALRVSGVNGVGQVPGAEDVNDCFTLLNNMLGQWQRRRWLVYHLVDVSITSTGAQSYTIGSGGDISVLRPDRLEAAFVRQFNTPSGYNVDYPLELLEAREDYNRIALKTLTPFPQYVFYDAAYPLGVVYPWPIPQASIYALHLTVKATLNAVTDLTSEINLPPEYNEALLWNLAVRLRPLYQLDPDPQISGLARAALELIRNENAQVPRLQMPQNLWRGGRYDVFSDIQA